MPLGEAPPVGGPAYLSYHIIIASRKRIGGLMPRPRGGGGESRRDETHKTGDGERSQDWMWAGLNAMSGA